MIYIRLLLLVGLTFTCLASAAPFSTHQHRHCPSFEGSFSIENFKLYPENSDFDPINCRFYVGSDFNATVLVYDPYTTEYEILEFPGISHTDNYHISGIRFGKSSGSMFFVASSASSIITGGQDLSGPNKLIKWDPQTRGAVWIADLDTFKQAYEKSFGHLAAGFQDTAEDLCGNTYVPTMFGGKGIAKVTVDGTVTPFYLSNSTATNATTNPYLYAGIVALRSDKLVISDSAAGTFVTFDVNALDPTPITVNVSGLPSNYTFISCDAVISPSRYHPQEVLLCAEDFIGGNGAITVFVSKDNWTNAKYVGAVFNTLGEDFMTTASVQIADSIFLNAFPGSDGGAFAVPGNRSIFPFIDITEQVDNLLAGYL